MEAINVILEKEMRDYAKEGLNGYSYFAANPEQGIYTVVVIANVLDRRIVNLSLFVRLKGDCIIIEHDSNSDPLYEALMQAGIPRDRIVLAYAGEKFEEAA